MINQRTFRTYLMALITLMMFSCDTEEKTQTLISTDLIGCWTHAMEEDYQELDDEEWRQVYRPCEYKEFEASRYRAVYDLKEEGQCEYLALAANDAHSMVNGLWEYYSDKQQLIIKQIDHTLVAEHNVLRVDSDRLVLRQ